MTFDSKFEREYKWETNALLHTRQTIMFKSTLDISTTIIYIIYNNHIPIRPFVWITMLATAHREKPKNEEKPF